MTSMPERDAAQLLWNHWQAGTILDALPADLRPKTRAQGYAIQARLPEVTGREVVGWKIAATSVAGQRHIGVDGPLAGRILAGRVHESGATLTLVNNRMRVAEPEFAFRFARDLAPRSTDYSVDEVLAAVESLHPALEVPDSRYADFATAGEAQLLADDSCAHRFVVGPAAQADWRALDLRTHRVHARVTDVNGRERYTRSGDGTAVLGDPRVALAWLVNELSGLGITLQRGQFVSTGTCMVPLEVLPGNLATADYGVLGSISVRFEP